MFRGLAAFIATLLGVCAQAALLWQTAAGDSADGRAETIVYAVIFLPMMAVVLLLGLPLMDFLSPKQKAVRFVILLSAGAIIPIVLGLITRASSFWMLAIAPCLLTCVLYALITSFEPRVKVKAAPSLSE